MIIAPTADQTRTALLPVVTIIDGELALEQPYTGPRAPKFIPLAVRMAHASRHAVTVRSSIRRWAHSRLREIGESLVGYFLIVDDAPSGRHALCSTS